MKEAEGNNYICLNWFSQNNHWMANRDHFPVHSISDLEETVADEETRLTTAEENIQGIKRTKVKKNSLTN